MENHSSVNPLINIEKQAAALVYFYSNKCAPCISLRPKITELIKEHFPKMKLIFIESEKVPELCAQYQIFASPTLLLYFDGKETKRFSKYISTTELAQYIDRYYNLIFEE